LDDFKPWLTFISWDRIWKDSFSFVCPRINGSEIYDENKASALFMNAKEVMELGRKFLKGFK